MAAQRGSLVLLKVEGDKDKNIFITIGGMRTTKFVLNNQLIDCTTKISGNWRELLSESGISSVAISGSGIFTDTDSENRIKTYAFSNTIKRYELHFGNGDKMSGAFQIVSYERTGSYNEEEHYAISLESSGLVEFS
jgi:TP901-1 family phage major tail protein